MPSLPCDPLFSRSVIIYPCYLVRRFPVMNFQASRWMHICLRLSRVASLFLRVVYKSYLHTYLNQRLRMRAYCWNTGWLLSAWKDLHKSPLDLVVNVEVLIIWNRHLASSTAFGIIYTWHFNEKSCYISSEAENDIRCNEILTRLDCISTRQQS